MLGLQGKVADAEDAVRRYFPAQEREAALAGLRKLGARGKPA